MHHSLPLTGGYRNLLDAFTATASHRRSAPALTWIGPEGSTRALTWDGYHDEVVTLASALASVGVCPGDRVGILSENRYEWLVADLAILAAGAVTVAPHAPLTARQIHFQLRDAEVSWLFVSDAEQLAKLEQIRSDLPDLRGVVGFDTPPRADVEPQERFLTRGRRDANTLNLARERTTLEDLAGILYTSGTTGNPKGVMLTHGNLLSNAHSIEALFPAEKDDLRLAWLPFTHIYARTVDHYTSLLTGVQLFLAPNGDAVPALLPRVRPTHMASVPRLYEKILAAVSGGDEGEVAARLQALFGPRRKWFSSGGAPLPPAIAEVYRRSGVLVLQGYGLTESSPVISFNHPDRFRLDTVGPPLPGVEVAIAPDGEILTRGPHVMKGYWKNPTATAEIIRDGWLYTGDLGELTPEGFLKITGRKKEMMVLSNGKKIAPSNVEGLLIGDPLIEQAVVYGEGHSYLVALIVPRFEAVRVELARAGIPLTVEEIATHPEVEQLLRNRIDVALAELSPSEQVRKFVILPEAFSVAREELTVSLKLRRSAVLDRHRARLEALYARDNASAE